MTRADKTARRAPDLVGRDFTAPAPNVKWCGDLTEIPTAEGKLYLAAVEDLVSRRLLGFAMSDRHDAELAVASLRMAAAVAAPSPASSSTDQGSEYAADLFGGACRNLGVTQSMGRAGSARLWTTPPPNRSSPPSSMNCSPAASFATRAEARAAVAGWIDRFYSRIRRHSSAGMRSPIDHELAAAAAAATA